MRSFLPDFLSDFLSVPQNCSDFRAGCTVTGSCNVIAELRAKSRLFVVVFDLGDTLSLVRFLESGISYEQVDLRT